VVKDGITLRGKLKIYGIHWGWFNSVIDCRVFWFGVLLWDFVGVKPDGRGR